MRDAQRHSRQTTQDAKPRGTLHGPLPDFETHPLGPGTSRMVHRVAPILEKVMMQIDLHGASIGARATKGGGVGEVVKLINAAQVRSEYAADWTGVRGAIGVAAHSAKHRAHVEAGAAADAMQHVALFDVREQFASAIVEEYDVKFFGAVDFVRLARAADQSVIAS